MAEEEEEVLARYVSNIAGHVHVQRRKFQDEICFERVATGTLHVTKSAVKAHRREIMMTAAKRRVIEDLDLTQIDRYRRFARDIFS